VAEEVAERRVRAFFQGGPEPLDGGELVAGPDPPADLG